jgi:hypothetical protein
MLVWPKFFFKKNIYFKGTIGGGEILTLIAFYVPQKYFWECSLWSSIEYALTISNCSCLVNLRLQEKGSWIAAYEQRF